MTSLLIHAAVLAASLAVDPPPPSHAAPTVAELCARWDALEKQIRDGLVAPPDAEREIAAVHAQLGAALGGTVPPAPFVFPLKGYTHRVVGGKNGNGYYASRYDFYNASHRSGHPAQDIFIEDDNEDTLDDRTGRKVEVLSADAGVVLSVNREWDPKSEQRGGRYVWVFSPEHNRYCYYAHLDTVGVEAGDVVAAGATLGLLGRTGKNAARRRSPTHLHFMCLVHDGRRLRPQNTYAALTRAYLVPEETARGEYRWLKGAAGGTIGGIGAPRGFSRTAEPAGSFAAWIRDAPLVAGGAAAQIDAGAPGPEPAIGAVARLRAEHLYARRLPGGIAMEIAPGLSAPYGEWIEGYRPHRAPGIAAWMKTPGRPAPPDHGYEGFRAYLRATVPQAVAIVPAARPIGTAGIADARIGDLFINAGAPGRAAMIVDVAVDAAGARKLLVASAGPATRGLALVSGADGRPAWHDATGLVTIAVEGWTYTAADLARPAD